MAVIKGFRAAAKYAGVSYETIRNWHRLYGVGVYSDDIFYVEEAELAPFIERNRLRALADEKINRLQKS